jgi:hypothetical protein
MSADTLDEIQRLQHLVERFLLPQMTIDADEEGDPVDVHHIPQPWQIVGKGNYAVVVTHPEYKQLVVKIYADPEEGLSEEVAVYKALGKHEAYSEMYAYGTTYLILKRLQGYTLYDCVIKGIRVEKQVFADVEAALEYARMVGLYPHDVHGKNLIMHEGRGFVVDVSDFYKNEYCSMWDDLKKAYERFYLKTLYRLPIPIPAWLMNAVRKGHRAYRRRLRRQIAK